MADIDTSSAAINALLDGVTKEPWSFFQVKDGDTGEVYFGVTSSDEGMDICKMSNVIFHRDRAIANARFITWCREGVPALSRDLKAMRAERDAALECVALEATARAMAEAERDAYVVWSHEHGCWWRANFAGYTTDVRHAGVYARAEAISISHRGRDGWSGGSKPDELPIRVSDLPQWAQDALKGGA